MMRCPCEGTGWIWMGVYMHFPAPTTDLRGGQVGFAGWAACADCNDDEALPKPRRPQVAVLPLDALN